MTDAEKRKLLAANAFIKLTEVEALVAAIIATYGDYKVSAAHPRSGLNNTLKTLGDLRKSIGNVK